MKKILHHLASKPKAFIFAVIAGSVAFVFISGFLFGSGFVSVHKSRPHRPFDMGPASASSTAEMGDLIQDVKPWMTFEYLNMLFKLPPQHFKEVLHITSARYPRITIGGAAQRAGIPADIFVEKVKSVLSAHIFGPILPPTTGPVGATSSQSTPAL
jgi:hypothetical protein